MLDLKQATQAVQRLIGLLTYGDADEARDIPAGKYIRSQDPGCRPVGFSFEPAMSERGCFPGCDDFDNMMAFSDVEATLDSDGVNEEGWSVLTSESFMGSQDFMSGPWPMKVSFLQQGDRGYAVIQFLYQQNDPYADWGIRDVCWFTPGDDGYRQAARVFCDVICSAKVRAVMAADRAERLLKDTRAA